MDDVKQLDNISVEEAKEDWLFELLKNETYSIAKYIGNSNNVIVPSFIDGKKVSEIRPFALYRTDIRMATLSLPFLSQHLGIYFLGYHSYNEKLATSVPSSLKTVFIRDGFKKPDGRVSLGGKFYGCRNIESIIILNGITDIDEGAFNECYALKSLTLPDSIKSIGKTFTNTYGNFDQFKLQFNEYENGYYLGKISNPYFAFIRMIDTNATDIVLHKDTKIICGEAFKCSNFTCIDIPFGVTSICKSAFKERKNLKIINIPNSVEIIGDSAFESCENLEKIKIPDGVKTIGLSAFDYCKGLKEVEISGSIKIVGVSAFSSCHELTRVDLCNGVEIIDRAAFSYCPNIEQIVFPDTLVEIRAFAFRGCKKLKCVTIHQRVKVDDDAFDKGVIIKRV